MDKKCVKDLMVPIDEYPVVSLDTNMLDAILTLNEAQKTRDLSIQPYRAVLVADRNGRIVGKLGQLAFLKALEPKYGLLGDVEKLHHAGVSDELISQMVEHYRILGDTLSDLCAKGCRLTVKDAMHPITECIDEYASLSEAINKIVIYQQLSLLVMRGDKAVGLLRLSDLCDEVARQMKEQAADQ